MIQVLHEKAKMTELPMGRFTHRQLLTFNNDSPLDGKTKTEFSYQINGSLPTIYELFQEK